MEYSKFQIAVVELADEGTRLTAANVVARLRVDPKSADEMLARMTRDGRLEREVDEESGLLEYRVKGTSKLAAKVRSAALQAPKDTPLPMSLRRKVPIGLALGFFLPGLGLAYAAPWTVVGASTLAFVVGFKVLSWIPLLSTLLLPWFVGLFAVASGVAGALYTWQYNQTGRRTPLRDEPKQLISRLKTRT